MEKIAFILKIEPYLLFKSQTKNSIAEASKEKNSITILR